MRRAQPLILAVWIVSTTIVTSSAAEPARSTSSAAATDKLQSPIVSGVDIDPSNPEAWRYKWHDGRWWYYQENGQWRYWDGKQWSAEISATTKKSRAAGTLPMPRASNDTALREYQQLYGPFNPNPRPGYWIGPVRPGGGWVGGYFSSGGGRRE